MFGYLWRRLLVVRKSILLLYVSLTQYTIFAIRSQVNYTIITNMKKDERANSGNTPPEAPTQHKPPPVTTKTEAKV